MATDILKSMLLLLLTYTVLARYEPNWKSIDSRKLPAWYDESKIGIFITWGVFSVPSFGDPMPAWLWSFWKDYKKPSVIEFMKTNFKPDITYQDFAKDFTAEFFDADEWAELFKASGARYKRSGGQY